MMKKILLIMLLALPFLASAASKDDSRYLRGAVPERDGLVTFTQTFAVQGKTQAEIFAAMQSYVRRLVAEGRQDLRTRVMSDQDNTIIAKVEEVMTFKKKFLNWDHCYFRYLISAECTPDAKVRLTLTQISYQYLFDNEGNGGETYKAEEWISDAAAINKSGTKLYPRCGKFRRKTVDRVNDIFNGARDVFEQPQAEQRRQATTIE